MGSVDDPGYIEVDLDRETYVARFIVVPNCEGKPAEMVEQGIGTLIDCIEEDGVARMMSTMLNDPDIAVENHPFDTQAYRHQYTLQITDTGYEVTYNGDSIDLSDYHIDVLNAP